MEILDYAGKVIELCRMDGAQNDSIRKLQLILETLQANSRKIAEAEISSNLQQQIKDELLEAEKLIK